MKKITQILLGIIALVTPLAAYADAARTPVTDVVATSNYAEIIGYGEPVIEPIITTADGSIANVPASMIHWQQKEGREESSEEITTFKNK